MSAVTWQEVRDHLVDRLSIDSEWMSEDELSLTWWPFILAQRIHVRESGLWADDPDDYYLTITADTPIAIIAEEPGIELAASSNAENSIGAAIWEDGVLRMTASLCLHPVNRAMLAMFHQIALAQVTIATTVALDLTDESGAEIIVSTPNPPTPRQEPDELLWAYRDEYTGPLPDDYSPALQEAIERLVPLAAEWGWQVGFVNDEVTFLTNDDTAIEVAVARLVDNAQSRRYGPGLDLLFRILPAGEAFDPWLTNNANQIVSRLPTSQLCAILGQPTAMTYGSHLCCHVMYGYLAENRLDADRLATTIFNVIMNNAASLHGFRSIAFPDDPA